MKVIILCGTPGSGKSTLATTQFAHIARINQDELGSREECLRMFNKTLSEGKDCVVDRCNHTVKQRAEWIKIARMYNASVHCVYLEASPQLCLKRISTRKNHPTINNMTLDKMKTIVLKFNNEFQVPKLDENLDSILSVRVTT